MNLRAILDLGLLDIRPEHLIPDDPNVSVADASSDMLIINFDDQKNQYKVGDMISFHVKYMGALSLLSSDYIEKQVI
jgi:predicted amino acid racemase